MGNIVHVLIVGLCIVLTFVLYNKMLSAIPLLFLSGYLFFLVLRQVSFIKKNKRM